MRRGLYHAGISIALTAEYHYLGHDDLFSKPHANVHLICAIVLVFAEDADEHT